MAAGGSGGSGAGAGGSGGGSGADSGAGSGATPAAGGAGGPAAAAGSGGRSENAGAGAGAGTQLAVPIERGGKYVLELGEVSLEVDPRVGGRITAFSLRGRNVLTTASVDPNNWGSTLWPSPQQVWGWPPPPELDSAAYTARVEGDTLVLVGPSSSGIGLSLTKRFRAHAAAGAIAMEFTLHNTGASAASWAPWQVTRVGPNGLTFFPTGSKTGVKTELAVQQALGITWYQHDPAAIGVAGGQKYIADGAEGWLAHVSDGLLFLKAFADVPPAQQHAQEGEIEIYANMAATPAQAYVEVEAQGALVPLAPGAELTWAVTWFLRELPAGVSATAGNPDLAAFARSLLQ